MSHHEYSISSPRRFRPTSIISNPSTTSSHSNLNNFPVGLIKVYQSDEEFSNDSFSITSKKLNDAKSILSQVDPIYANDHSATSLSDSNDISYGALPTSFAGDSLLNEWNEIPVTEREKLVIPNDGMERPKYVLDKIAQSFRSKKGAFLTKDLFLDQRIYQQSGSITNGSVKINIIQEINTLLRKFQGDLHDISKFNALESTLTYYKKLMDAFDVLQAGNSLLSPDLNDSLSSTSTINTPLHPYKTASKSSSLSIKKSNQSLTTDDKPKKRNSLLFDKLKVKMKSKKRLSVSNWDPQETISGSFNEQVPRTHSRSVSVSSTQTQASSRSAKDQATIQEYLETIETLQITLTTIYNQHVSEHSETYKKLSLVVQFLSQYIVKFVMSDITALSLKYLKETVKDLL